MSFTQMVMIGLHADAHISEHKHTCSAYFWSPMFVWIVAVGNVKPRGRERDMLSLNRFYCAPAVSLKSVLVLCFRAGCVFIKHSVKWTLFVSNIIKGEALRSRLVFSERMSVVSFVFLLSFTKFTWLKLITFLNTDRMIQE